MADLPKHEERHVREYVEGQVRDKRDPVMLVQKVGSERVLGETHAMYDVQCKKSRWWVISSPLNLYLQKDFPSVDMALTFHVGIALRMMQRSRREQPEETEGYGSGAWRRYEQAVDTMDSADEAEDFQAVGVKCREALIALAQEYADARWVGSPGSVPKSADVKGWGEVFAQKLATGRSRTYLKGLFDTTWDLAVWLQHFKNATEWDAELVLDATSHLLGVLAVFVRRMDQGSPTRCPGCGSYRVTESFEAVDEPEPRFTETPVCGACDWHGDSVFTSWAEKDAQIAAYQKEKAAKQRASRKGGAG